jgi:hypothetical protein
VRQKAAKSYHQRFSNPNGIFDRASGWNWADFPRSPSVLVGRLFLSVSGQPTKPFLSRYVSRKQPLALPQRKLSSSRRL